MPRYNGTGPLGLGPGTGWGLGPCGAGMAYGRRPARRSLDAGRDNGRIRGFGWRRFWGYYPTSAPSKKEETKILSEEAEILEQELKTIKARLAELKDQK